MIPIDHSVAALRSGVMGSALVAAHRSECLNRKQIAQHVNCSMMNLRYDFSEFICVQRQQSRRRERKYGDQSMTNSTTTKGHRQVRIEAYGVKGGKSRPWRRCFANAELLVAWCERNDAVVLGIRNVDEE